MPFQNLRTNNQIFILYKDEKPRIEFAQVQNITNPTLKYPSPVNFSQPYNQQEMIVDVSVKVGEVVTNFQKLPANADIADFGNNIVLSCSREAMNAEVEAMRKQSLDVVNSVERHKQIVAGCDDILSVLNPEIAERQRQEADNKALRDELAEVKNMLASLLNEKTQNNNPKKKNYDNN